MKGNTVLAITVCIACFLMGYLAYTGAEYFVEFLFDNANACQKSVQVCTQEERAPHHR